MNRVYTRVGPRTGCLEKQFMRHTPSEAFLRKMYVYMYKCRTILTLTLILELRVCVRACVRAVYYVT